MQDGYTNLPDFTREGTMGTIARDDNNMQASKAGKFSGENKISKVNCDVREKRLMRASVREVCTRFRYETMNFTPSHETVI